MARQILTAASALTVASAAPAPAGAVCAGAAPPPPCRQARATTPQTTPQPSDNAEEAAQNDATGDLPAEIAPGDRVEARPTGPLLPALATGETTPLRDAALLPPLRDIPTTGTTVGAMTARPVPANTSAMLRRPVAALGAGVETSDRLGA